MVGVSEPEIESDAGLLMIPVSVPVCPIPLIIGTAIIRTLVAA